MTRLSCFFDGQMAGYIVADRLEPGTVVYEFVPVRSVAHLRLVEEASRDGGVLVVIEDHGTMRSYQVRQVTATSITLQPL